MADSAAAITPRPILMRDSIAARVVRRHKRKPSQVPESQPPPKKARKSVIQFRLSPDKVVIPEHPPSKDATGPMPKAPNVKKIKKKQPKSSKKIPLEEFRTHPKVIAIIEKAAKKQSHIFQSNNHREVYKLSVLFDLLQAHKSGKLSLS